MLRASPRLKPDAPQDICSHHDVFQSRFDILPKARNFCDNFAPLPNEFDKDKGEKREPPIDSFMKQNCIRGDKIHFVLNAQCCKLAYRTYPRQLLWPPRKMGFHASTIARRHGMKARKYENGLKMRIFNYPGRTPSTLEFDEIQSY